MASSPLCATNCRSATGAVQPSALEDLGIVTIKKGYVGKRPRTWLSLSADGR
ncbi:hypothetical protein [Propioniciclava flava]